MSDQASGELAVLRDLRSAVFEVIDAYEKWLVVGALHRRSLAHQEADRKFWVALKEMMGKANRTIGVRDSAS